MASGSFDQDFDSFRDQIGKLAERGCFDRSARVLLDQAVRESIPVRVRDTYYYRYDYRLGTGFIDLVPGMRLKIERAEFNPSGKFQGTYTLDYEIVRDSIRTIRLELEKTEKVTDESAADRELAAHQTGMFFERLFFLGKQVPPNLNYSAMVVGTRSPEQLEEITQTVKTHPESGCPASAGKEIVCTLFQGSVSVTVEIEVTINGARTLLGFETTLRNALPEMHPAECRNGLRIRRDFLGKPTEVNFDATNGSILDLVLVAGDRISCSAN